MQCEGGVMRIGIVFAVGVVVACPFRIGDARGGRRLGVYAVPLRVHEAQSPM